MGVIKTFRCQLHRLCSRRLHRPASQVDCYDSDGLTRRDYWLPFRTRLGTAPLVLVHHGP
ncbi:hypothetical protein BAUCODRAFT_374953 [Baudoinia panamericana UAMH 10762]|uniref:Uncharacterized protein n=1 Tax=Baudoinia panamericana (strain UAMH 10762) TaxID=717646 RepID=M2NHR5_BAUPA|nr:uncharacterized protein BAUCODRAFT_374953 [Baudoinia panamericana UAMH 10762]EMC98590.1 hypothetical protein BAUCODRAFT_374953 [Baudoinia panamericana UAMH 10762]